MNDKELSYYGIREFLYSFEIGNYHDYHPSSDIAHEIRKSAVKIGTVLRCNGVMIIA